MKRILFFLVCSCVNLLIFGVTPAETSDNPPEPYRATLDKDGIQRVQILGGDYFFKPKHIIVKARVPVQLSVRVEPGIKPHDIVIKAQFGSYKDLKNFIIKTLAPLEGIIDTKTMMVVTTYKENGRIVE